MFKQEILSISRLLTSAQNIVLTSHHNPDGDAVGSMLGLYHILKMQGIHAHMVLPNELPDFLKWLPGVDQITIHTLNKAQAEQLISTADILFALDYNGPDRLENLTLPFVEARGTKILIDHHPHPEPGFSHSIWATNVSSTAELVYEFGIGLPGHSTLPADAALNIYVGIMTDTGSFSYGCSNPRTFEVVSQLVNIGVDTDLAQRKVYNTFSENRMKLLGHALAHKMHVFPKKRSAYISLTQKELREFGYKIGDTEGFVNYPLSIENIVFSAFFVENTNYIKVSLRSSGAFPVNEVCEKYFNGGGHRNAAGGKSFMGLAETEALFSRVIEEYADQLNT